MCFSVRLSALPSAVVTVTATAEQFSTCLEEDVTLSPPNIIPSHMSRTRCPQRRKGCGVDSQRAHRGSLVTLTCVKRVSADHCLSLCGLAINLATSVAQCIKTPHLDAARSFSYKSKWPPVEMASNVRNTSFNIRNDKTSETQLLIKLPWP